MSKEIYLEKLSSQIIDLIQYGININDIILQKVCVMVVTRISHICPTLCDRCILLPLAAALLNINRNMDENKGKSSESVISTGKDIEIGVSIFHAFVSLCPLQHPLQCSLQRNGVGKTMIYLCLYLLAEKREHHLLPLVKEFCFLFFQNSNDFSNLAVQLHDVIVTPTINYYSMDSVGNICIYKRIESSSHKDKMSNSHIQGKRVRTASDLAARLGVDKNNLDVTMSIITSPSDLISAISSKEQSEHALQSLSNNNCHSIEEGIGMELGPGQDVNAILSMAVRAAQSYESATAQYSVNSMPFRDISPHTEIVNNLLGQGNYRDVDSDDIRSDSDSDDEDEDGDHSNKLGIPLTRHGESGHELLEVGLRSRHTAELLLLSDKSMNKNDEKNDGKNDLKNNEKNMPKNDKKINKSVNDNCEEIDEKDNLISELFIYCLQSFLGVAKSPNFTSKNISGQSALLLPVEKEIISINPPVGLDNSSLNFKRNLEISQKEIEVDVNVKMNLKEISRSNIIVKNSFSGLLLVFLQSYIPMDKLLQGGKRNTEIHSR